MRSSESARISLPPAMGDRIRKRETYAPSTELIMGILFIAAIGILLSCFTGCSLTDNMEYSVIRCTGDLGVTWRLDHNDENASEIAAWTKDLLKFFDTGNASNLPMSEVKKRVHKIVPKKFHSRVDKILKKISKMKGVDLTKAIGNRNTRRVRALLLGIHIGSKEYIRKK